MSKRKSLQLEELSQSMSPPLAQKTGKNDGRKTVEVIEEEEIPEKLQHSGISDDNPTMINEEIKVEN